VRTSPPVVLVAGTSVWRDLNETSWCWLVHLTTTHQDQNPGLFSFAMKAGYRHRKSHDLTSCVGSETQSTLDRLVSFSKCLSTVYGVDLRLPDLSSCTEIREFCGALVEGRKHPWRPLLHGLSAKSRFGISHSLFLFRKVVPKEKPPLLPYVERLSSAQEEPDPHFLSFAVSLTQRLFKYGWDRGRYERYGRRSFFPTTSCAEWSRMKGGSRGLDGMTDAERSEFCSYVLSANKAKTRGVSVVQAVESGGKWRIISLPPRVDNALRALHHSMYDHLSRFDWLLRGDAKPSSFKGFTPAEGELFVSGDYESATDNLNSSLQMAIMRALLDNSTSVPEGIKEHALSTYESDLSLSRRAQSSGSADDQPFRQRRGQLMGQLTSFPMLCLVNYITFRYFVRRRVPVKINGDDIVFRATPVEYDLWRSGVAKGGLTLSEGKTMKDSRFFTLNSTPFKASSTGGRLVGFVRPSACWKKGALPEQIRSLNSRFYSVAAGLGRQRSRVVRAWFLEQNLKAILASRRSLTRGLGLAVDEGMLRDGKLWHRELFYLERIEEPILPAQSGSVPPGWHAESVWKFSVDERRAWEALYRGAVDDHRWHGVIPLSTTDTEMELIRQGCVPYGLPPGRKYRRMLRLSRAAAWDWFCRRRNPSVFGRVRFSRKADRVVVLRDRCYSGISVTCPRFIRSDGTSWLVEERGAQPKAVSPNRFGWDSLFSSFQGLLEQSGALGRRAARLVGRILV